MTRGESERAAPDWDPVLVGRAHALAQLAGGVVAALGLASLVTGPAPVLSAPRELALGFVLAGVSLVLAVAPSAHARAVARVLVHGLLSLAGVLLVAMGGVIAPYGPSGFLLVGATLKLQLDGRLAWHRTAELMLAATTLFIGTAVMMVHAYGVQSPVTVRDSLARQVSIGFLILSAGLICARPEEGPVSLLVRRSLGAAVARRLMVPGFFALTVLRVIGQRLGLFESPRGVAVVVLASFVTATYLIVHVARYLDATDRARQAALAELQSAHDELEARVASRTGDLRASESAMAQARDAALSASRAKSEFLAAMSHELRTPLNAVVGVSWLLQQTAMTAEQRSHVQLIRSGGMQLLNVIDGVLDLSKIEAGKLSLVNDLFAPRTMVQTATQLLAPRAEEKGLALVETISPAVPEALVGDAGRLRQVLLNLLGNAIKFTERGRVEVALDSELLPDGKARLVVRVRDSGIGIPEDKQKLVFERFTQADASTTRRFGGTGLGLAISQQLIGMMGGTIGVKSAPDAGAEFWFAVDLPVAGAREMPRAVAAAASRAPADAQDAPLVLVVEDDATNQFVSRRMLELLGCTVQIAPSGPDALASLAERRFDAIYMDCQMPLMDGYETTARIRAFTGLATPATVPIVGLTAYAMQDDRKKCLDAGMDDYLSKPVSWEQLRDSLARWVRLPETSRAASTPPPTPAPALSPGTLDPSRLSFLNSLSATERQVLMGELTKLFMESTASYLKEMRRAAEEGDENALRRVRHKLKGSSLNIGATHLAELASGFARGSSFEPLEAEVAAVGVVLSRMAASTQTL